MSKIILKYPNDGNHIPGESILLKFDWDKCMGAYEYGSNIKPINPWYIRQNPIYKPIIDSIKKYDKLNIPAIYHSDLDELSSAFIIDTIEIERHLKLQKLDI